MGPDGTADLPIDALPKPIFEEPAPEILLDLPHASQRGKRKAWRRGERTRGGADGGGWAELRFADQGPGSAPADLQRIFERFEQGRSYIKVGGGLGLGRYISREIVRAHGGEILVRSPPREGATFIVRLPLSPPRGPIDR